MVRQPGFHDDGHVVIDERLAGLELVGFVQHFGKICGDDGARTPVSLTIRNGAFHGAIQRGACRADLAEDQFDHSGEAGTVTQHVERVDRLTGLAGAREVLFGLDIAAKRNIAKGARVAHQSGGERAKPGALGAHRNNSFKHLRNSVGPSKQHELHGGDFVIAGFVRDVTGVFDGLDESRRVAVAVREDGSERSGPQPMTAVIMGSGFGGSGMAIKLRQAGISDFVLLEKSARIGGTWRDNTPGAACDVPSPLSFSFEQEFDWPRFYSAQPDIHRYQQHCVAKYRLMLHIRLNTEVRRAAFDERRGLWRIETSQGDTILARALITATGQLNRPTYPKIAGLQSFHGKIFHSSRWDHAHNLADERVGIVGTGASAIQFVAHVVKQAGQVTLFQPPRPMYYRSRTAGSLAASTGCTAMSPPCANWCGGRYIPSLNRWALVC
jgi:Pyridine nucleotide-disulphide oxidoreductase